MVYNKISKVSSKFEGTSQTYGQLIDEVQDKPTTAAVTSADKSKNLN